MMRQRPFFHFRLYYLLAALLSVFIAAAFICKQPNKKHTVTRGFYFWKFVYRPTNFEKERLDSLGISKIYLHFFDVGWDDIKRKAVPMTILNIPDSSLIGQKKLQPVPTVFITNESLLQVDSLQAVNIGEKIAELVNRMIASNKLEGIREIQIDCDWTATTRNRYFALLNTVKGKFPGKTISATIRLHQVKFIEQCGIPPVDTGLLMCYNMGNLTNPATANSIIDVDELLKYTGHLDKYPLPLDIALPLFEWNALFRNNIYRGLIREMPESCLHEPLFTKTGNRYTINADTMLSGYAFRKGDQLRHEHCEMNTLLQVADALNSKISNDRFTVTLFHLDSITLKKYSINELESIYNRFR